MDQNRDLYLEAAQIPSFIDTETMARNAVKAVLGILVSKLSEGEARNFTKTLPEYLNYEKLRGHQENPTPATPSDCVNIVAQTLDITKEQAQELMLKIISVAKREAPDEAQSAAAQLSSEWLEVFETV